MKGYIHFSAVILSSLLLFSCSSTADSKTDSRSIAPASTADGSLLGSKTISDTKMKTVIYTPSILPKSDTSDIVLSQITISIPGDWKGVSGNYTHYDHRTSSDVTVLEIRPPIKIDENLIPSKDMIFRFGYDRIFSRKLITSAKMVIGETSEGYERYDFVASNKKDDLYLMITFVRIDDSQIIPLSFVLPYGERDIAEICVNSLKAYTKSSP